MRTSGQQAQRSGWTGDEPAPLAPGLARRPRQPSGTAPSGAAPGMSAPWGGVRGQGRRLEHDHPGGRAAPSRTREIPTPRRAAARPTTASRWQRPQAAGRRHDRPGDSCLPSGCCKSPSPATLARRPAREGTRGSGGHRPEHRLRGGRWGSPKGDDTGSSAGKMAAEGAGT